MISNMSTLSQLIIIIKIKLFKIYKINLTTIQSHIIIIPLIIKPILLLILILNQIRIMHFLSKKLDKKHIVIILNNGILIKIYKSMIILLMVY